MKSELKAALEELKGKTPDEIAALMKERGIKGRPATTQRCPLAMFFNGTHSGRFVIGREFIMRIAGGNSEPEKAPTPKNLSAFVRMFDTGSYPELIAMPPRCTVPPSKRKQAPEKRVGGDRHKNKQRKRIHYFAKDVSRYTP